jgi:hypothetical protein
VTACLLTTQISVGVGCAGSTVAPGPLCESSRRKHWTVHAPGLAANLYSKPAIAPNVPVCDVCKRKGLKLADFVPTFPALAGARS